MTMWCTVSAIFAAIWVINEGIRLYPCGDAGYQDVEENTPLTFYCDQYTGQMQWGVISVSGKETTVSDCTSTCTEPTNLALTVTAISSTNSSLTTPFTARQSAQSGILYLCSHSTNKPQCGLHVYVPAVVSQPTSPVINRQDSGYTLSASVNVTRVYSSRGNYSCLGQLGPSRQTTPPDLSPPAADTSNTADRTGRCDVTMSLPDTSGTYPCSVTVTPGNTQASCGNITITRPSPPTMSCSPGDLIAENTSLTCTCNTANIGQPGGRLRWFTGTGSDINTEVISGAYDVSTLDRTWKVGRGDNNKTFRCINNWIVNVTAQSNYTARVAYGPDTVSIQGNTPFYTDTNGTQRMTLTCQAGDVNPSSALTYNWDVLCDDRQQSTCTFRPRPGPSGDDNKVITCTVNNTKNNNKRQQHNVTLDIKYPPVSAPHISGYVNGQVLYEGDSLTLTCNVTGGDPVVNSTTLTCPGRQVQNPTPGQFSNLTISRLNGSDHNLTCVCRGQWVRESYYTLTDSRTLTVYYPPSTPTITRTDGKSRPALEGDTVSLTCSLTSFGHPAAERTWVSEGSNAKDPLQLDKVGRGDNRTVTCQASNGFTQHKGQQLIGTFVLQVYYHPSITVQPREDNGCAMTSDGTSCHITEGQGVHLQCKADSNPAPQNCTWRFLSGSGIVLDTGTNLDLVSANRTDSGVYQVEVNTTKPDVTDDRLPLTARSNLTVLVKYSPTSTQLTVNNSINITVNENEAVTLTCQSRGRPTPRLELLQRDVQLARQDGGQLSLSEEITHLSHHTAARCNNTGTLTCRAENGVGSVQDISVQFYVNCKPRQTTAAPAPPKINFINTAVSTAFHLQAFPLPDSFTFHYLGTTQNFSSRQPVPDSINVTARCNNTFAAFAVQCDVSVNSVKDSTAAGFYTFTAANAFGQEQLVFQVAVNSSGSGLTDGNSNAVAIGSGIAAGLIVIGVIALVCYCCRRRKKHKDSEQRSGKTTETGSRENADRCRTAPDDQERIIVNTIYDSSDNALDQERVIVNTIYESSDNADQERVIVNTIYESSDNAVRQAASPYEDVVTEPGRNPTIVPEPQPGPSGAINENVYAVVNKAQKTPTPAAGGAGAAAAGGGNDAANVYTIVDKKAKTPAVPPAPAEAGPSTRTRPAPAPKPVTGRGGRQTEAAEGEYGNIATAARPAPRGEATVYENHAFQPDDDEAAAWPKAARGGQETGRRNADGLNYTTVVFTKEQQEKANDPVTPLDKTDYASLNFTSMAKNAKKKAKK